MASRGQLRFHETIFTGWGRGPRLELWSLTEEQMHKTSKHESLQLQPPQPPRPVGGEIYSFLHSLRGPGSCEDTSEPE